jgi:hypothetical protein
MRSQIRSHLLENIIQAKKKNVNTYHDGKPLPTTYKIQATASKPAATNTNIHPFSIVVESQVNSFRLFLETNEKKLLSSSLRGLKCELQYGCWR